MDDSGFKSGQPIPTQL